MKTLISLVSKQTWPQILSTIHLKPKKLVLLHSQDDNESKIPAERLSIFFTKLGLILPGNISLVQIPHDDFQEVKNKLGDSLKAFESDASSCILNFTGGNKLMATASFEWATANGVRAFYLEKYSQITWFEKSASGISTRNETLDGHITDSFPPCELLKCQLDASDIEREGETLKLKPQFNNYPPEEFEHLLDSKEEFIPGRYFEISGEADKDKKAGDTLEYVTATVLLGLGVKSVNRSLRLEAKRRIGFNPQLPRPHAEIDLIFTWGGKMWLVDCKDRIPSEWTVNSLRNELKAHGSQLSGKAKNLIDGIEKELGSKRITILKEDMAAIREIGGLLGKIVCVRKESMPDEVKHYAKLNGIEIVQKSNLHGTLKALLYPNAPAEAKDLSELENIFNRK